MKVGMFQAPFPGPKRSPKQAFDWAIRQAVVAHQSGFSEYWVVEHATLNWAGIPSPELVVAAAANQTGHIKLGPRAHLLPYHHPATFAVQTAWMSQILQGRYMLGVATNAYSTDAALRGISDMSQNDEMMLEALEIMERVRKGEPYQFQGKFWKAGYPTQDPKKPLRDTRPFGGKMTMAMTDSVCPRRRSNLRRSVYTSR